MVCFHCDNRRKALETLRYKRLGIRGRPVPALIIRVLQEPQRYKHLTDF